VKERYIFSYRRRCRRENDINSNLKRTGAWVVNGFRRLEIGSNGDLGEHGNEFLGSVKGGGFPQFVKDSAPWS
jgi:hypothetical protein